MPPELLQTDDVKVYAKAATKAIIAYGKSFAECNGQIEALALWQKKMSAKKE